jgi:hypothetical protein
VKPILGWRFLALAVLVAVGLACFPLEDILINDGPARDTVIVVRVDTVIDTLTVPPDTVIDTLFCDKHHPTHCWGG